MFTAPLLLGGCASPIGVPNEDVVMSRGRVVTRPGRPGIVVAAPHGTSDIGTGEIAAEIARRTGFSLIVAAGFTLEPDTREGAARRYQVNRPFEGVPGRPASEETTSEDARRVYLLYEARVRAVAQGPLRFYVEIHGHNRPESAEHIEVATVGFDREQAVRLRTLFELVRDAHLAPHRAAPRLTVLVEGANVVRYTASGAKRDGILRVPARALHIELPWAARDQWRAVYTRILAEAIVQTTVLSSFR